MLHPSANLGCICWRNLWQPLHRDITSMPFAAPLMQSRAGLTWHACQAKGKMEDLTMPWDDNSNLRWRKLMHALCLTPVQRTSIVELRRHLRSR